MKKAIFIILILATAHASLADYHYASHNGSNEYPYTSWATAADSIQKAINAAEAGDTVYVGGGIWNEVNVELYPHLALIGRGIDSSIFHIEDFSGHYVEAESPNIIEGFKFQGGDYHGGGVSCFRKDSLIIIRNCYFTRFFMGINADGSDLIVESNVFFDNDIGLDFGSVFQQSDDAIVQNNTFDMNNRQLKIWGGRFQILNNIFVRGVGGGGNNIIITLNYEGDTAYVANNIVYKNGAGHNLHTQVNGGRSSWFVNNVIIGIEGDTIPHNTGVWVNVDSGRPHHSINNVIMDCSPAFHYGGDDTVFVYNNDLWNNEVDYKLYPYPPAVLDTADNIDADPMFMDSLDFRLQMCSPLIDAGHPDILDVDGTRSDIGPYGGPGGEMYSYIDLPPRVPDSLGAEVSAGLDTIYLSWRYNTEADFNHYFLHRDTVSGFEPSVFNLIGEPDSSVFIDNNFSVGYNLYYRIAAVDNQDNVSYYSEELEVVFTSLDEFGIEIIPRYSSISTAYPNPFNTNIVIDYYLSNIGYQPAPVKLYVYDLGGRLVRRLVDTGQNPGHHRVVWDGTDDHNEGLASGIYFLRLIVTEVELSKPRKITLMK